jgi:predicted DNA-binding WGR domain protein
MEIRLEHIDPRKNMRRFYEVGVEPNLLGDHSCVIKWGRIGKPCRIRIHSSGPRQEIDSKAKHLVKKKIHKGYVACDKAPHPNKKTRSKASAP